MDTIFKELQNLIEISDFDKHRESIDGIIKEKIPKDFKGKYIPIGDIKNRIFITKLNDIKNNINYLAIIAPKKFENIDIYSKISSLIRESYSINSVLKFLMKDDKYIIFLYTPVSHYEKLYNFRLGMSYSDYLENGNKSFFSTILKPTSNIGVLNFVENHIKHFGVSEKGEYFIIKSLVPNNEGKITKLEKITKEEFEGSRGKFYGILVTLKSDKTPTGIFMMGKNAQESPIRIGKSKNGIELKILLKNGSSKFRVINNLIEVINDPLIQEFLYTFNEQIEDIYKIVNNKNSMEKFENVLFNGSQGEKGDLHGITEEIISESLPFLVYRVLTMEKSKNGVGFEPSTEWKDKFKDGIEKNDWTHYPNILLSQKEGQGLFYWGIVKYSILRWYLKKGIIDIPEYLQPYFKEFPTKQFVFSIEKIDKNGKKIKQEFKMSKGFDTLLEMIKKFLVQRLMKERENVTTNILFNTFDSIENISWKEYEMIEKEFERF